MGAMSGEQFGAVGLAAAATAGGLNLYAYTDNPRRTVDLQGLPKACADNVEDCPFRKQGGGDKEDVAEGEVGSCTNPQRKRGRGATGSGRRQQAATDDLAFTNRI